jgi:hypothetical protein
MMTIEEKCMRDTIDMAREAWGEHHSEDYWKAKAGEAK